MRVFATAAFSFSAAILSAQYLIPERFQPYCAAALLLIGVCAAFFAFPQKKRVLIIAFSLAAGFAFNYAYSFFALKPARELDGTRGTAFAEVCDYPEERSYGERVKVRLLTEPFSTRANVYTYSAFPEGLRPGDRIVFTASFSLADEINGAETDYFFSKGYYLSALRAEDVAVTEKSASPYRYFYVDAARAVRESIRRVFPESTKGFALAVLTGDKSLLPDEDVYAMQRSGIYHIATVSGMHVAMLAAFVELVFGKRRWTALITVPMLAAFAAISGFTPSVIRAVVMQVFIIAAPVFKREGDRLTSLSAAMLVILIFNPFAAKSAGFQLSFAATMGILLFSDRIYAFLTSRIGAKSGRFIKRLASIICGSAATSLGALILTYPLSVIYFGYISLVSPISNLLIVWALSPAFILSAAASAAGFAYLPAGRIIAYAASVFIKYIELAAKLLAKSYLAAVYFDSAPLLVWLCFVYGVVIVYAAVRAEPRRLVAPAAVAATALCVILLANTASANSGEGYTVAVLDVGQGQCIVITSGRYTAVIDCGSTTITDAGAVAAKYIYGLGRDTVDLLMLTHYHADHANGVRELMGRLRVDAVAVPLPENEESGLDEEILDLTLKSGAELVFVTENITAELGSTQIELYAPMGTSSENERGVCMLISEDGFDTLVTGDIDSKLEKMLIGANTLPDIECLVVGHHGSRYSTSQELLRAVTPEIGVISVGYNTYGHPSEECLYRLEGAGIEIFRTDLQGSVVIKSKGN